MDRDLEIIKTITEKLDGLVADIEDQNTKERIYDIQNDLIDLINIISLPENE